jgi:hypothetical protein
MEKEVSTKGCRQDTSVIRSEIATLPHSHMGGEARDPSKDSRTEDDTAKDLGNDTRLPQPRKHNRQELGEGEDEGELRSGTK